MGKVQELEKQIEQLSDAELAEFRSWYAEFDAQVWDRQFEADVKAGKLDALAEKALREHAAGKSTKLLSHHASPERLSRFLVLLSSSAS
jgi:hypothetical protein